MRKLRGHTLKIGVVLIVMAVSLPAAAQLFPGVTIVNDPVNKVVLLQQLTQLDQQLQLAEANIKNINGGWGTTVQSVAQINSTLSNTASIVSSKNPQSLPVSTAASQLQQMTAEESALSNAQALSDASVGQVQVTAAGNRFQSLAVAEMQEEHELMIANTLQTETYEQQATADQTNSAEAHALDGRL